MRWTKPSIAPYEHDGQRLVEVTHPFHPLFGRRFAFVDRRRNWSEDRVYFHDEQGALCSVPTGWTDDAEVDPFVVVAAGRCPFRIADLLDLADLLTRTDPPVTRPPTPGM